jgi:arsenite/tail-anchored protein-transporting ATPase
MPELAFFIGKGGVGKTTVSSAYAASWAAAHPRKKVLLLSTDPAHNLADIVETTLGDKPTKIRARGLHLWQVHAEKHFREFLKPYRDALLDLIESGTIFTREEIEPLLETTLPGMAEISALIAISQLLSSDEFDAIVVDTAPMGHTLRMFEMPQHFVRFLDFLDLAGSRDRWLSQRFGEKKGGPISSGVLEAWRAMAEQVRAALTSENAQLYLVTTPEEFSLNEAARSAEALAASVPELRISGVVLNRAVNRKTKCVRCRHRAEITVDAKKFIEKSFGDARLKITEDQGAPVVGISALRALGDQIFRGKKSRTVNSAPARKMPAMKSAAWPIAEAPLLFTMGKGGVGKTTVSASLGFHQREDRPKAPVTVCSTDPAPSLDDIFAADVTSKPQSVLGDKKFFAMEMDSVAEFRSWADRMRERIDSALSSQTGGGVHVDLSFDRKIFSSLLEIVPPGVDEIFAIFKILDLLESGGAKQTVIIDMAPTGHALELLRMPERMLMWSRLLLKSLAPHRTLPIAQDVAVQIATLGQRVRELAEMLKSGSRANAFAVTLAEPLPDRETGRLLASLKEMGIGVSGLFVNRVLMNEALDHSGGCERCKRAQSFQATTLAGMKKKYPKQTIYLLPEFGHEVVGCKALQDFTGKLWQLA